MPKHKYKYRSHNIRKQYNKANIPYTGFRGTHLRKANVIFIVTIVERNYRSYREEKFLGSTHIPTRYWGVSSYKVNDLRTNPGDSQTL